MLKREEVDRMKKLMEMTNNVNLGDGGYEESRNVAKPALTLASSDKNAKEMKRILSNLYGSNPELIVENNQDTYDDYNPEPKPQRQTPKQSNSILNERSNIQVDRPHYDEPSKRFKILIREVESKGRTKTIHEVLDTRNKEMLFSNITLEDSSDVIRYYLEKGFSKDNRKIQEVLELDEEYTQKISELRRIKVIHQSNVKSGNIKEAKNAENKFNLGKEKAKEIRVKLKNMVESIS